MKADFDALAHAMSDPIRSKVFFALADRPIGATVRQLSQRIDEPQRRVRYHLDAMVDQGLVVVAGGNKRRGAVERIFRAVRPPFIAEEEIAELPEQQLRQITLQVFRFALAEAGAAVAAGTFWRLGYMQARAEGEVDEEGWLELSEIQKRAVKELDEVLQRSRRRVEGSEAERITAAVALWLFEMPRWPQ